MTYQQYLSLIILTPVSIGCTWFIARVVFGAIREAREELKQFQSEIKEFTKKDKQSMKIWPQYNISIEGEGTEFESNLTTNFRFHHEGKWYLREVKFKMRQVGNFQTNSVAKFFRFDMIEEMYSKIKSNAAGVVKVEGTILDPNQQPE